MLLTITLAFAEDPPSEDLPTVDLPAEAPIADLSSCPDVQPIDGDFLDRTAEAPRPLTDALDALLFPPSTDWQDKERRGVRTDGVVIVQDGAILYERYGPGWDKDRRHLAWSATKSFTSALVGIAVREGLLSVDDSICDHLRDLPEPACEVTIDDLLAFASGFDWHETYEGESPRTSSVLAMLYGEGRKDMASFTAHHPLRDPPGSSFMYSSGDTNVLAAIVTRLLSPSYGEHFPWTLLFDPIGANSPVWERDASGTYVGSSYLWATPRDLARFGWLLRSDGCFNGERVLPEGWIDYSTTVSDAIRQKPLARDPGDVQGRQFWLNQRVPEIGQAELPWPSAPEDAFAAQGHWKQSITVIPSLDLVIVRTADDRDDTFQIDTLLRASIALAQGMP